MVPLDRLDAFVRQTLTEWQTIRLADLVYRHRDLAISMLVALTGLAIAAAVVRSMLGRKPGREAVTLPALLEGTHRSAFSFVRHGALLVFLTGLPFFAIALADPYTTFVQQEVEFPGRRIALMIDASASMMTTFPNAHPGGEQRFQNSFFTTVTAAEIFVRQRMAGNYRDLISLIEFGDQAYVITPFTNDYDNLLLSLSLIGDWTEFTRFPNQGTTIALALDQGINLFRAFDFLDAAGNMMVIFSDGQDAEVASRGVNVNEILSGAADLKVPVYFIRVGYNRQLGEVIPDPIWKAAVEATGGRFYAGADEATILRAVREIDRLAVGKVAIKHYSSDRPRFSSFASIAVALWTVALFLHLTVPYFQKFP